MSIEELTQEAKLRGFGINPDTMPVADESDNYRYTPEATIPDTPMPEKFKAQDPDGFPSGGTLSPSGQLRLDRSQADIEKLQTEFNQQAERAEKAFKQSNIWKRYTFNQEDVLQEARHISVETGIPEEAILADSKNLDNARDVYNYRRKQMALMPPGENEVSLDKLMEAYPGLRNVVGSGSNAAAAIALHNIENVKQVHSLLEAAKVGWEKALLQHDIANIGRKGLLEKKNLTEEDYKKVAEIQKKIDAGKEMPGLFEAPLTAVVGGTSQQIRQQLTGFGRGSLYGAALGAAAVGAGVLAAPVTGGVSLAGAAAAAKTGFALGMRAGWFLDMWEESAAQRFVEYSQYKDSNGKRTLTNGEARAYAAAAAAVETGIEFANAGMILKVLKGNKTMAAESIRSVIADAADSTSMLTGLRQILQGASSIAVSESIEEGSQEFADRMISNVVSAYKGGTIPHYTLGQSFEGAVENALAAVPASIGFGAIASGGGSIRLVRRTAALAEMQDLHLKEKLKNITGISMHRQLKEAEGVKDFFKKDPEIAAQVVHDSVQGTNYEKVNIDTEMVLQQEGGEQALQALADKTGLSNEELQAAIETKADITVPYEVYYQAQMEDNFAIGDDFISFSDVDHSYARNQYLARQKYEEFDALMDKEQRRQEAQRQDALDNILQKNFAEGAEMDAAAEILMVRPDKPLEGWQALYDHYKQALDNLLDPIIKDIREFTEKGAVSYLTTDRDPKVIYGSNNAQWYRDFLKDFGRRPTQDEYRQFAIDALTGKDFSKHPDLQRGRISEEQFEENAAVIDNLQGNITALDAIKDRIQKIDPMELEIVDGLSKEAYDIYRSLAKEVADTAPNEEVKRAGRISAALLARHADRYADAMRAAGHKKYTALDYYRDRFGLQMGGVYEGGMEQSAMRKENKTYIRNSKGDVDWGYINDLTADDGTVIKGAPIRMQIGFQVGKNIAGAGYTHITNRHPNTVKGYGSVEKAVYKILQEHAYVVAETTKSGERLKFFTDKGAEKSEVLVLDLCHDDGDYYTVISILPQTKKQVIRAKEKALSFNGSGTPLAATGDGALYTPSGSIAGTQGDLVARKDNAYSDISLSEAEEAVKTLTYTLEQRQNGKTVHGATSFEETGRRVVSLFESADESTFPHELGHIFVADLKELAEMPNAPEQIVKDWETVKEWLNWKEGQVKLTVAQHEKFARGWEAYLRTGNAPATGLQKVFRKLKAWLTQIYRDFLQLGGVPSEDMQAVMGRMVATEEEVETAFKLRELNAFERAGGFEYLAEDSMAMYRRWQESAVEYAKEKVLAIAMKDLTAERKAELNAVREQMEQDIRAELEEQPLYKIELLLENMPAIRDNWDATALGMTEAEYAKQIKKQGTLEQALKKRLNSQMKELTEGMPLEQIKEEAKKAVDGAKYRGMYLAFEEEFIKKKLRKDAALTPQIEKMLDEIEKQAYEATGEKWGADQETDQVKNLKHRIRELKYQARWEAAERDALAKMEKAKDREELKRLVKGFKNLLKRNRKHVKIYRDATLDNVQLVKTYAEEKMAGMAIAESTNVRKWQQLEKRAGRESTEAMKRALDAELKYRSQETGIVPVKSTSEEAQLNSAQQVTTTETLLEKKRKISGPRESANALWKQAYEAKLRQRIFAEYAAIAQKNKDMVQKKNGKLKARSKTISRNNHIPAAERYLFNHGLYVLGISKQDAPKPQEEMDILKLMQAYAANMDAFFVDEDGNVSLPGHIVAAMGSNTVYNDGFGGLNMEEYEEFTEVLDTLYKIGLDANKFRSIKDTDGTEIALSDICEKITAEAADRVPVIPNDDPTNAGTPGYGEQVANLFRTGRVQLTKPEEIFEALGPTAHRFIYENVNQSWNKEKIMLEEAAQIVKAIWEPYTDMEKSEMRSKKKFRFGSSILTREGAICVALNWGTEINRRRIMDGFGITEKEVRKFLGNLTQKDWQMVEAIWDLCEKYWPESAKVEEDMAGVTPRKQSAIPFQIVGNDGLVYTLKGGYYPIKYDPAKSVKAANQNQDDVAKQQMAGSAAMGRRRGHMKERVQGTVNRKVLLSFDVLNSHINDVIDNICFRRSLRDVNRVLHNQDIVSMLQDMYGLDQVLALQQWVRDCWAPDKAKSNLIDKGLEFFRHKQTLAVLMYRVPTAIQNSLNIFPMVDYIGPTRAMDVIPRVWASPKETWAFVKEKSAFLRNRAETMDRDAGEILRKTFIGGHGKVIDTAIRGEKALEAHAFDLLAATDLALAIPLWVSEYERIYQELGGSRRIDETSSAFWKRIETEAVSAGDKAVRQVFGSGEMKDLAPVQKESELSKSLTMFYSYFNVVFNALYRGYAEGRRRGLQENHRIIAGPLLKKLLLWVVLVGIFDGLEKYAMDVLTGNDDKKEGGIKGMLKRAGQGVGENFFGTIPVVRDVASGVMGRLMGNKYPVSRPLPLYGAFDQAVKAYDVVKSDKKNKIDVFREGARTVNSFTGIGHTISDAFATTAYWIDRDFDTPFYQYLLAVLLDKRIDRKKK